MSVLKRADWFIGSPELDGLTEFRCSETGELEIWLFVLIIKHRFGAVVDDFCLLSEASAFMH